MDERAIETIEMELAILIRRATSAGRNLGTLDRSAYLLLNQIASHSRAGVKTLADEFHLDISTVSRQTAALEQKGYVTRIPDPDDGRAYVLEMTELGAKELEECRQARFVRFRELLKDWPEADRAAFGRLLHRFNRTFS
ncbi:MarR family winged helix-turn-helix transcriptional regulator [Paenibacillus humicola]|uniref:MarR family winged helix-turn-helix transcriptional regulator n=1 Tax=Paenibacillus humicola TaxID=3110540 RepID=UPI00237C2AA9|nr:MarR family transcriptional regulator [Paenibacillus humicola]